MNIAVKKGSYSTSMSLSEAALFILTLMLWSDRILLTYARAFIMRLPIIGFMVDYFIIAVYVLLIALALPTILRCMRASDLILGLAVIIICLLNFIIFTDNIVVLEQQMPTFLFFTFPLYYIGLSIDYEKIYPWLYKLSIITIIAFTLYKLFLSAPMDEVESLYAGDMWSAYNILPHVCVVALAALKKPKVLNVTLTVIGIVMISALGSRGPLLCVVLAIVVYLIFFKKYKRPFLAYLIIIAVAVIIVIGLEAIMLFLYGIAKDAGLSIRIFEKFFEGVFSDSSGRSYLIARLYDMILANPVFGYGMFADRVAIDTYAHHIAIELWHSFGIFFGTAILGTIIIILGRAALIVKKVEKYAMLFIPLLFAGFIKLFLSNSYLEEIYLFWLLGIAINFIRNYKIDNQEK